MSPHNASAIRGYQPKHRILWSDEAYEREIEDCARERATVANGNRATEAPTYCDCAETLLADGTRIPSPKYHSCSYCRARSELVPIAADLATLEVGDPVGNGERGYHWTKAFVRHLDMLAAPLLKQSGNGGA